MDHALKLHSDNSQDTSKEPKEVCPCFFFFQRRLKFNGHVKIPVCIECTCMFTLLMSVVP